MNIVLSFSLKQSLCLFSKVTFGILFSLYRGCRVTTKKTTKKRLKIIGPFRRPSPDQCFCWESVLLPVVGDLDYSSRGEPRGLADPRGGGRRERSHPGGCGGSGATARGRAQKHCSTVSDSKVEPRSRARKILRIVQIWSKVKGVDPQKCSDRILQIIN